MNGPAHRNDAGTIRRAVREEDVARVRGWLTFGEAEAMSTINAGNPLALTIEPAPGTDESVLTLAAEVTATLTAAGLDASHEPMGDPTLILLDGFRWQRRMNSAPDERARRALVKNLARSGSVRTRQASRRK